MHQYATSVQQVLAELERIDLLIQVQVWRARQLRATDEEFQGLYISEQEVNTLLAAPAGLPRWAVHDTALSQADVQSILERLAAELALRKAESIRQGVKLRLEQLACLFQLTPFDVDALLICLAPEIDLRYERLYAYLQDDVTKKRPSVDLVLNLLSPTLEAKLAARQRFTLHAPLFKQHVLQLFDDATHPNPPLLSKFLKVDEQIVNYLFDDDELDARLSPYVQQIQPRGHLETLLVADDLKRRLAFLTQEAANTGNTLVFYFQGPYGVGKQTTAEALCQAAGTRLLVVDSERLLSNDLQAFATALDLIHREALLHNATPYWKNFEALLADDKRTWLAILLRAIEQRPGLTFLAGETAWEPVDALYAQSFVRIEFPPPTQSERMQLWPRSLNGAMPVGTDVDMDALANKFRLTGGQIRDAAATARNLARWRDPENGQVNMADLHAASRLHSNRKLATLAHKITPHYTWNDIVLPADRLQQLREICNQVKYRAHVYETWGFDHKLALGKGLNALFAGPSGTGKTMAADILAHELGLDLYKIDLSTVVSKYIGETEKNLARIFVEAETSNAILFFDEADALFGKRSEVRDAHDRYANIEIAYLLQKMEEYDGVVILATNLRKNMDDAFVRRLHFTVEFPFPSEKERRRIWEHIWPANAPRSPDLDLDFMARRIEVAGGNIRNIALAAAFLAADDGQVVTMAHLIHATKREYQKMGKVVAEGELGEYAGHTRR